MNISKSIALFVVIFSLLNQTLAVDNPCTFCPTNAVGIGDILDLKLSPTGDCVAVSTAQHLFLFRFNKKDYQIVGIPSDVVNIPSVEGVTTFAPLAFSPNGFCLAVILPGAASDIVRIYIIDESTCTFLNKNDPFEISSLGRGARSGGIAFSPNGSCFAVANFTAPAGTNGRLSLFSVTGECELTFTDSRLFNANPNALAFSPNSNCLALSLGAPGNILSLIPILAGYKLGNSSNIPTGTDPHALAFSPDGNCLAVSENAQVEVFSVNSSNCTATSVHVSKLSNALTGQLAYTNDGSCLYVTSNQSFFRFFSNSQTGSLEPQVSIPSLLGSLIDMSRRSPCFIANNGGSIEAFVIECDRVPWK